MSLLIQQINESASEHVSLVENATTNVRALFEGFSDDSLALIAESAAKYLGQIAAQLKFNRKLQDMGKAVDMITAFRVLGSSENRDAFNIRQNTFKVLVQKAGEDANVDNALAKLSRNPSVATVRQQVEAMLNAAVQNGDNELGVALSNVNKLRLGYERVQNKLQSGAAGSNAVSQPSNSTQPSQSKPTAAWTNPQGKPAQPQRNSATGNRSTTAAN